MPLYKKILIGIAGLALFLLLLNYGLSTYISYRLPAILHEEKDFPYDISYDDLDINILSGSFTMHNATMAPKDTIVKDFKKGVYAKVKAVKVQNFSLWALLGSDKIKMNRVILDTPEVILYDREKKYNVQDDFVKPFRQTITTGSLGIINGKLRMLDKDQNLSLLASKINFEIEDIKIDSAIAKEDIPVRYSDYKFSCDSVFYRIDKFYDMTATKVINSDSSLTIKNFRLTPKYSKADFTKSLKVEKDLFNVTVKQINVPSAQWGYYRDELFVYTPNVILNSMRANVYRNKLPADDPTVKKMYSELLRSIKFDLKAEKVQIKDSHIQYEEQLDFSKPAAKVIFADFYATIHNLYSPVNKKDLPLTTIDAQCMFMGVSPFKVSWSFNTLNKNDAFTIKGNLQRMRSEHLNRIVKPLMNITTEGLIKNVYFSYAGNKHNATGNFAMNYEGLKVKVFEEDGKEKKGFMTTLGNLIIKDDSDDKSKQTQIEVTRAKDKSFFNFLWLCTQDGIRKAILPKIVEKALPDVKPAKEKKKRRRDRKRDKD
jgi:hypothetical protein